MAAASQSIRAFAAVELDASARAALAALVDRLRVHPLPIAWVRPENLHLTLRFFGSVDAVRIEKLSGLLRSDLAPVAPFEAKLRGAGAFPSARRPVVLWSAMEGEAGALHTLYSFTERAAQSVGLEAESRAFVPHVTLGRVRRGAAPLDLAPLLDTERDFQSDAFTIGAVSLFGSELTPQGAHYTRLHRLTLDGLRGARDL